MNEEFTKLWESVFNEKCYTSCEYLLEESVTFYNLRQFVTLMITYTTDVDMKNTLKQMLIILTKMEIMNKPVPNIKKLTSASPAIFD